MCDVPLKLSSKVAVQLKTRSRGYCLEQYKIVGSVPLRSVSLNVCTPKNITSFHPQE